MFIFPDCLNLIAQVFSRNELLNMLLQCPFSLHPVTCQEAPERQKEGVMVLPLSLGVSIQVGEAPSGTIVMR